jgi:hypothetical protein
VQDKTKETTKVHEKMALPSWQSQYEVQPISLPVLIFLMPGILDMWTYKW